MSKRDFVSTIETGNELTDIVQIKKLKHEGEIESSAIDRTLQSIMCSLCCDIMYAPITNQCKNGHTICGSCAKQCEMKCPSCRLAITHNRNLVLEQIAGPLVVSCCNEEAGCKVKMPYCKINEHISKCEHQQFSCCPFKGCIDKISLSSHEGIKNHFKNTHGIEVAKERYGDQKSYEGRLYIKDLKTDEESRMVVLFEHEGFLFLEQITQFSNREIHVRVQGVGKTEYFKKCRVMFKIKDRTKRGSCVMEPVRGIQEIYENGEQKSILGNEEQGAPLFRFNVRDLEDNYKKTEQVPADPNISSGVRFTIKISM